MSDKTFRQETEKILGVNDELNHGVRCKCSTCLYRRKQVDLICLAVLKRAEGMPDESLKYDILSPSEYRTGKMIGAKNQLAECQAYWRKQVE